MIVRPELKQAIYALGVHMSMVSMGSAVAFPATLIPSLMEPSSGIKIDPWIASWIASMPGVSAILTILFLGPLMHYGGRKIANICLTVFIFLGWILTYFAAEYNSIAMLLTGRFLQGLALGAPYFISVCIGEFSAPRMRSVLLGFKPILAVMGMSMMHVLSHFLQWRHLALVGAIPPALAFLITLFWPETPEWLVSRERYGEAEAVFYSLRGYSEEAAIEIKQLTESAKERRQFASENRQRFNFLKKLNSRVLWRPVGVLFVAVLTPSMGGRLFIPAYSIHLAAELSGDNTKGYLYTVIGDFIAVSATFVALYLLKLFSRRRLLFGTGFLGFALLVICSALLYLRQNNVLKSNFIMVSFRYLCCILFYCKRWILPRNIYFDGRNIAFGV